MKASGKVNYPVEEVFNIFIKAAKREFKEFNEENPIGCKIVKNINSAGSKPLECTVEITDYVENKKYEITTSNSTTSCVSTYTFSQKQEGYTLISLEESQTGKGLMDAFTLMLVRWASLKHFKKRFNAQIENLENQLKQKEENLKRSEKKS